MTAGAALIEIEPQGIRVEGPISEDVGKIDVLRNRLRTETVMTVPRPAGVLRTFKTGRKLAADGTAGTKTQTWSRENPSAGTMLMTLVQEIAWFVIAGRAATPPGSARPGEHVELSASLISFGRDRAMIRCNRRTGS
jgi:hypothetical protein